MNIFKIIIMPYLQTCNFIKCNEFQISDDCTDVSGGLDEDSEWVIQPMLWGLVPSWSKTRSSQYKMNNARSDGLMNKDSFKSTLQIGRRCVILVEGYSICLGGCLSFLFKWLSKWVYT